MSTRPRWPAWMAGVLLTGLLTACQPATDDAVAPPTLEPLRLAIDRWPGYYPAVLAADLGYFEAAGLQVDIQLPGNTDRMLSEFAAGGYDMVGVALGDLITLTRNRPDVTVLLVSDESAGGDALLARAGWQLEGAGVVRIGTNLGGFGELFIRELLPRLGVDNDRIEWINIDASAVPAALAASTIDLGHCWEPYASEAEQAGAQRILSSADTPGLIPDVIAGTHHLTEHRTDELRAFAASWFRAVDWWRAHPEEAQQRIEARLQLATGEASLKGVALQDLAANRQLLGADGNPALRPVIDRYIQFFLEHGRLLSTPPSDRLMSADHLP